MNPFYNAMTFLMKLALLLVAKWQGKGREHVPPRGPIIIVSNHLSMIDPPLLAASIPHPIVYMAKEELSHHPYLGWAVGAYGAFTVKWERVDRQAMRRALGMLKQGKVLGLFLEGSRSRKGQMRHAHPGTALIALQSGAAILPVGITGSERIQSLRYVFSSTHTTVNIGVPFQLEPAEGRMDREELTKATELIMRRIAELLPPDYQGVYRSPAVARAS